MDRVTARVRITGKVQGVWFRQSTKDQALRLGVSGWCRNCADGSVEVMIEGEKASVQKLIDWCHKGPPLARVAEVEVTWPETGETHDRFDIRS